MRLPGGRGRLALRSGSPEPPARAPRGEARRGEAGSASGGGPCHVWPAAAAGGGITQVTFTGSHFAETIERAILEVEEKISLQEILRLDQRSVALPSKSSVDTPS
ncbi:uncharacterized protein LOC124225162 isoform X6 [Equus quagga]|uniref:uncharacterized protein LOC124225162 isoform X6 n=1 Tax=Equus quagga TaxID=89248 RepID=UPI001EE28179|nr:uncharacterized protein LOC124225162 isoform X6 [Equus quagga]